MRVSLGIAIKGYIVSLVSMSICIGKWSNDADVDEFNIQVRQN